MKIVTLESTTKESTIRGNFTLDKQWDEQLKNTSSSQFQKLNSTTYDLILHRMGNEGKYVKSFRVDFR